MKEIIERIKQWFIDLYHRIRGISEEELPTSQVHTVPEPAVTPPAPTPAPSLHLSPMQRYGYIAQYFYSKGNKYTFDKLVVEDGELIVLHYSIDGKRIRDRRQLLRQDLESGGTFEHFRSSVLDTDLVNLLE